MKLDQTGLRHVSVRQAVRWLQVNPALPERQAAVAALFESTAETLLDLVSLDDPELTRALVLLTQAKDAAVRASLVTNG